VLQFIGSAWAILVFLPIAGFDFWIQNQAERQQGTDWYFPTLVFLILFVPLFIGRWLLTGKGRGQEAGIWMAIFLVGAHTIALLMGWPFIESTLF
jgi:hypothetical protein